MVCGGAAQRKRIKKHGKHSVKRAISGNGGIGVISIIKYQ